jgi:hypothetical protein
MVMNNLSRLLHLRNFSLFNILFWILFGLMSAAGLLGFFSLNHINIAPGQLLVTVFSKYSIYCLLSYWIFELYIRARRKKILPLVSFHLFCGIAFAMSHKILSDITDVLMQRLFRGPEAGNFSDILHHWQSVFFDVPASLLIYAMVIGILSGLDYYLKFNETRLRFIETDHLLNRAKLNSLQMQLQPHFIFNAFNTIAMMIRGNHYDKALHMINNLSSMLRYSLKHESRQFITLTEELELVNQYLEIEMVRYEDRLTITRNIDESLLLLKVPSLVLQPIIENAFKHGISQNPGNSILRITVQKVNQRIMIEVYNNDSSLPLHWDVNLGKGIGLSNTILRLTKLYREDFKILVSEKDQGVAVCILLPEVEDMKPVPADK